MKTAGKVLLAIGIIVGGLFAALFIGVTVFTLLTYPASKSATTLDLDREEPPLLPDASVTPDASTGQYARTPAIEEPVYKTYTSIAYGFSIQYPPDWSYKEDMSSSSSLRFPVSFVEPVGSSFLTNNVIVGIEGLQGMTFSEYIEETNRNIADIYSENDYALISKGIVTVNYQQVPYFEHAVSLPFDSKIKQVFIQKSDGVYIISFTARAATYGEDVLVFNEMLSTFRFTR